MQSNTVESELFLEACGQPCDACVIFFRRGTSQRICRGSSFGGSQTLTGLERWNKTSGFGMTNASGCPQFYIRDNFSWKMHPICRCKRQKCQTLTQAFSFFFFYKLMFVCCLLILCIATLFPPVIRKNMFSSIILLRNCVYPSSAKCVLSFSRFQIQQMQMQVLNICPPRHLLLYNLFINVSEKKKRKSKDLFCGVTACYFFFHGRAGLRSKR